MKKKLISVVLVCFLLLTPLCVSAAAEEDTAAEIDNNVFFIDFPEGYVFDNSFSQNFYVYDDEFGTKTMEFFVEGNLMFPRGLENETDQAIIDKVKRVTEWGSSYIPDAVKRGKINGQSAVIITGTDEFIVSSSYYYYIFATKEAVCIIEASFSGDEEKKEIESIISTFVLNGTSFNGETPILAHDFTNSPDYYEQVNQYAQGYYESDEEFEDNLGVVLVIGLIVLLSGPALIIVIIALAIQNSKRKKIIKEYESSFGHISAVRSNVRPQPVSYNNMYNQQVPYAQPYQPQGFGQPYQVQQPENAQPPQTQSVLNGQPQNKDQ